jgi:hypothetical protein
MCISVWLYFLKALKVPRPGDQAPADLAVTSLQHVLSQSYLDTCLPYSSVRTWGGPNGPQDGGLPTSMGGVVYWYETHIEKALLVGFLIDSMKLSLYFHLMRFSGGKSWTFSPRVTAHMQICAHSELQWLSTKVLAF